MKNSTSREKYDTIAWWISALDSVSILPSTFLRKFFSDQVYDEALQDARFERHDGIIEIFIALKKYSN